MKDGGSIDPNRDLLTNRLEALEGRRGGHEERSARFLQRVRPNGTSFKIDAFQALLDAAGELEAEARVDRKGSAAGRRAPRSWLGGFRINEMLDLRFATVDLVRSRFKVRTRRTRPTSARSR